LAKAGILKGKRVTVYPADFALAEIRRANATYVDEPVVVDGNLITAVGPEAAKEFGEQIVKML
jgi:protease I